LRDLKYVRKPNGRVYIYRRVKGTLVSLPNLPENDPDFLSAYAEAGRATPPPKTRAKAGSLKALVESYLRSASYRELAASTKSDRRRILDRLCIRAGHVAATAIEPKHVRADLAKLQPSPANSTLKVSRAIMRHAIAEDWREDDPSAGIKKQKTVEQSYHSWTEEEIAQFEAYFPNGTKARFALALFLGTGQRISDVARMGRQHISGGRILVRQQKTGTSLSLPISTALRRELDLLPANQMTFLQTEYGAPFTVKGLGNWWRARCDEVGLKHWSAHGGRHAVGRRLAESGCTEHEIMSVTGHKTLSEVERYTRSAQQATLAGSALAKTEQKQNHGNRSQSVSKNLK